VASTVNRGRIEGVWVLALGWASGGVTKLYITRIDVQTRRMIFFNIPLAPTLKTWYTFRKFLNR
jgi:hypothetical protein